MDAMRSLQVRVEAAVRRTVERDGVSEREAFARHLAELKATAPRAYRAYVLWLAAERTDAPAA
jgi:hypothetical protein